MSWPNVKDVWCQKCGILNGAIQKLEERGSHFSMVARARRMARAHTAATGHITTVLTEKMTTYERVDLGEEGGLQQQIIRRH